MRCVPCSEAGERPPATWAAQHRSERPMKRQATAIPVLCVVAALSLLAWLVVPGPFGHGVIVGFLAALGSFVGGLLGYLVRPVHGGAAQPATAAGADGGPRRSVWLHHARGPSGRPPVRRETGHRPADLRSLGRAS